MKRILAYILFIGLSGITTFSVHAVSYTIFEDDQQWSRSYEILFSKEEQKAHKALEELYVEKLGTVSGTQVVFGWNALRPSTAQFTFFIKLHNARTNEWSSYHKVIEWGGKSQTSFSNKSEFATFLYARLEIDKDIVIDGFAIKVISDVPGKLGNIKGLFITVSDFDRFLPQYVTTSFFKKKSFCIKGVPTVSQILLLHPRAGGLCSPTSTSMVSSFLTKKSLDALEFSDYSYDRGLNIFGNWSFCTAHAFEYIYPYAYMYPMRLASIESLYDLVKKQRSPIVVSVKGKILGAAKAYPNGHLLVVVGFDLDRRKIICHDPAFREINKVRCEYDIQDFVKGWENSHRMTYKVIRKM